MEIKPSPKSKQPRKNAQASSAGKKYVPKGLRKIKRKSDSNPSRLIAYDFETTRITAGTPRPLYLTAHSLAPEFSFDGRVDSMEHLSRILKNQFLIPRLDGAKFVAWNANNFDSYFVAAALIEDPEYILRPYLTKSHNLRGLRVSLAAEQHLASKDQRSWEFLDGMAMLGLVGVSLEKFLKTFAPDTQKLKGAINFEKEEFDPDNPQHRAYAYRDSEGLYKGMVNAEKILLSTFNQSLGVTMGGACIKIFKANIPDDVFVNNLSPDILSITRDYLMRGGYCYCVKSYQGAVWKYDLNQAYAAAMREARLPDGKATHSPTGLHRYAKTYAARVTACNPNNTIPFYHRVMDHGRVKAIFSTTEIIDTWLTDIEVTQLRAEGWQLKTHESYYWPKHFSMKAYVDKLEHIRTTCEGGTSGAIGTMIKAVGNHSYGKTVEQIDPTEFLLSSERPDGFAPYYADGFEPLENVWFAFTDPQVKDYHQPHLGAWITAHVRMVVRRAALKNPGAWLYADTDCVVFSEDVTADLDIDPRRYGAWKIEESGTPYRIIAKKVYQNWETGKINAKGLNTSKLTNEHFDLWMQGDAPVQQQIQRNNFVRVMSGREMFYTQQRSGTRVDSQNQSTINFR